MTTKNAILMIVKQSSGIDYNSLLNKFASSYSNINSCRAALSRSLKDLTSFGFLRKEGGRFYLLAKGEAEIYSAVKNKLVLSLNAAMKQKHPSQDIDSIVQKLHILIERGKEDKDLLRTSKTSLDFSISDLEKAKAELEAGLTHLSYLARVFGEQIAALKEMDFYDVHETSLSAESAGRLALALSGLQDSEFTIECRDQPTLALLAEQSGAKPRETSFVLQKVSLPLFLDPMQKNAYSISRFPVTIFSSALKAQFVSGKIILSGPFSEIQKWRA